MRAPRIANTDPRTMTAGKINQELDKLDAWSSQVNQALIDADRGGETAEETYRKSDPLALVFQGIHERYFALRREIDVRYGPGAPSRLPSGRSFGPRR